LTKWQKKQAQASRDGVQRRMHQDEIPIDAALVTRLLIEQFPHLAKHSAILVRSTGTVNAIYRIGLELYVRLPRLEQWAESIANEWAWLPKFAPRLSLKIPRPVALGKPTDYYPCRWAIYRWIEGSEYEDALVNDERQAASDLVDFILELRSVDMEGAPRGGRRPLSDLDSITQSAIDSSSGLIDKEAVSAAWLHSLEAPSWDGTPVWLHGDLLKSNLLVQKGHLYAVLDFGGVGIGDPAADVVPAWSVFNKEGREAIRAGLKVNDGTWRRARGYALHQAIMKIPYYRRTNPQFVTMAIRTVAEVLSELK
jgi:aminoglycoside phosphotransferase (APT) family kinase protein